MKFSDYKERKIERLRLGQAACERVDLLSDPETSFMIVPLTEGEYSNTLREADRIVTAETPAGAALRDEVQRKWLIFYSARTTADLSVKFFDDLADVDELDAHDVNHIYDTYLEMVAQSSPALMGLSEADFNDLKVILPRMEWSALSGPAWYAAQRFLNSIQPQLLTVKSSGSTSTNS